MSTFQTFYERLHIGSAVPPPPSLRAQATFATPAAGQTLPPAWIEEDAWFRLYPQVAPPADDGPRLRARGHQTGRGPAPAVRSLKTDLLAKLDDYQIYAERLRRWDPESYRLFRRIGMYVPPSDMLAHREELEPATLQHLPGFGAVAIGMAREEEDGFIPPRFIYFRKLERPGCDIERRGGGVIYRCHIFWDDAKNKLINQRRGYGFGLDFAVHVMPSGQIYALRMRQSTPQTIRHKRGPRTSVVMHQRWSLPDLDVKPGADVAHKVTEIFCAMMNFWSQAAQSSMIRVTATKGPLVMPFVVDILRTPEFFRDREPVVIDGKKRRIFHIVRAHVRHTKRGDLGIRTHFAGLRRFQWNGYDIAISVPGRDHKDLADMTIGALEDVSAEEEAAGGFIEQAEFAEVIANAIGAPQCNQEKVA